MATRWSVSRQVLGMFGVLACAGLMAGCVIGDPGVGVDVENRCANSFEASIDDVRSPTVFHWGRVEPGERGAGRLFAAPVRRVYLWVRVPGSDVVPEPVVLGPEDLVMEGEERAVLVIEGELCPS